tara:strand:- start:292 stop:435 length:144 start_codon:yes stop_codon:yes gene_type:complete
MSDVRKSKEYQYLNKLLTNIFSDISKAKALSIQLEEESKGGVGSEEE